MKCKKYSGALPFSRKPGLKCSASLSLLLIMLTANPYQTTAQVDVEINVNAQHSVGGISTFDREKFITIHSSNGDSDWDSTLINDVMNGYDVYFGRDTGNISWYRNNTITQDGSTGWASESSIASQGSSSRSSYNGQTWRHPYESRSATDTICAQFHPFYPDGTTGNGWAFSQADTVSEPFGSATGHYMGHFLNEFYNSSSYSTGRPFPSYVEIINEPDWELWGLNPPSSSTDPDALWKFHNSVANQIRSINGDALIGGHCTAFPDFEYNNFNEWNMEWKPYIDNCGTNMDFHTLHFYDFNESSPWERRGSNMEATMDMVEHYSDIVLGDPLPFAITEFGGRDRSMESQTWSAERDWKTLKSFSSMMMSFMDRPNLIYKVIPFIPVKADWGYTSVPYPWRLMRKADEPASYTGAWVYTEFIKLYQLWSDVNGTRVDVTTSDPDVQIDAYVDGNKAYVILNNLNKTTTTVYPNLFGNSGNAVQSVFEKNMYWNGLSVVLDETTHTGDISSVQLGAEGTAVLEYTFASSVTVDETSDEAKYYAATYFQPITANVASTFNITGVSKSTAYGDAVLRLGMGRPHYRSKQPTVLVNGTEVDVPTDFMGHEGDSRSRFFGLLEIPVPYELLQANNTISVTYSDSTSGYISSVSLRVYEFSSNLRKVPQGAVITSSDVSGSDFIFSVTNGLPSGHFDVISTDDLTEPTSNWTVSLSAQFDALGEATVTNTISDDQTFYRVSEDADPVIAVTGVSVSPATVELPEGQTLQLAETVSPGDASNKAVTWSSGTPAIATVDANGLVTALAAGTAVITVTTDDGSFTDTCSVTVSAPSTITYDWSNYSADDWTGHIEQTIDGMTLNGDGSTYVQQAGQYAFQGAYGSQVVGYFTVEDASAVQQQFTVVSVDLGASTAGTTFVGTLGGITQWSISVPIAVSTTVTVPTSGDFTSPVDSITWTSAGTAWGYTMDNFEIIIEE